MEIKAKLYDVSREAIGEAVFQGAKIMADSMTAEIRSLPEASCSRIEKAGLIDGFGIARMQYRNGFNNVKLGFDGYNRVKTKKFPSGQPNAMIARSVEKGSSYMKANPFIDKAVKSARAEAEKIMKQEIEKRIDEIMGD